MKEPRASFVRRAAPVVALAAGGVALWHSLDASSANSLRLAARLPAPPPTNTNAGPGNGASQSTQPAGNANPGGASGTTNTTIASTVCAHPVQVTGPVVDTRWGPVQVRAELGVGNHVCSADAIVYPNERQRSVFINQQAVPWIDGEVKTQGVNFDAIGGATYTTYGYRQSLQSILDSRAKK